jgi:hypothetical protein
LPNAIFAYVEVHDEPTRAGIVLFALAADRLVQIFRDRAGTSHPILDRIKSPALQASIFITELAPAVGARHFDIECAILDFDEAVWPILIVIGKTNLIDALQSRKLCEDVRVVKKLEARLKEVIGRSAPIAERLGVSAERLYTLPAGEANARDLDFFRGQRRSDDWLVIIIIIIIIIIKIDQYRVGFADLFNPFVE